jgi:low affinity Fe/Cu permease
MMRNASNMVGRSIGRAIALVVVAVVLLVAAVMLGLIPFSFGP